MLKFSTKLFLIIIVLQFDENLSLVRFTGINCTELDKTFCQCKVYEIKAVKRDVSEVTIHVALFQLPVEDVTVHLGIKKRGFDRSKSVFQTTVDGCAFMRNKKRNLFADAMYKMLKFAENSNMNHTCPYNHDILLKQYRFDQKYANLLPLSQGHYTIFSTWSVRGKRRITLDLHLQFQDSKDN